MENKDVSVTTPLLDSAFKLRETKRPFQNPNFHENSLAVEMSLTVADKDVSDTTPLLDSAFKSRERKRPFQNPNFHENTLVRDMYRNIADKDVSGTLLSDTAFKSRETKRPFLKANLHENTLAAEFSGAWVSDQESFVRPTKKRNILKEQNFDICDPNFSSNQSKDSTISVTELSKSQLLNKTSSMSVTTDSLIMVEENQASLTQQENEDTVGEENSDLSQILLDDNYPEESRIQNHTCSELREQDTLQEVTELPQPTILEDNYSKDSIAPDCTYIVCYGEESSTAQNQLSLKLQGNSKLEEDEVTNLTELRPGDNDSKGSTIQNLLTEEYIAENFSKMLTASQPSLTNLIVEVNLEVTQPIEDSFPKESSMQMTPVVEKSSQITQQENSNLVVEEGTELTLPQVEDGFPKESSIQKTLVAEESSQMTQQENSNLVVEEGTELTQPQMEDSFSNDYSIQSISVQQEFSRTLTHDQSDLSQLKSTNPSVEAEDIELTQPLVEDSYQKDSTIQNHTLVESVADESSRMRTRRRSSSSRLENTDSSVAAKDFTKDSTMQNHTLVESVAEESSRMRTRRRSSLSRLENTNPSVAAENIEFTQPLVEDRFPKDSTVQNHTLVESVTEESSRMRTRRRSSLIRNSGATLAKKTIPDDSINSVSTINKTTASATQKSIRSRKSVSNCTAVSRACSSQTGSSQTSEPSLVAKLFKNDNDDSVFLRPTLPAPKKKSKRSAKLLDFETDEEIEALPKKPQFPRYADYVHPKFYEFLIEKMEPKYGLKTNSEVVAVAKYISEKVNEIKQIRGGYEDIEPHVVEFKRVLARKQIVKTHYEFFVFCWKRIPIQFTKKVFPLFVVKDGRRELLDCSNYFESILPEET